MTFPPYMPCPYGRIDRKVDFEFWVLKKVLTSFCKQFLWIEVSLRWNRWNGHWNSDSAGLTHCHFSCTLLQSFHRGPGKASVSPGFIKVEKLSCEQTQLTLKPRRLFRVRSGLHSAPSSPQKNDSLCTCYFPWWEHLHNKWTGPLLQECRTSAKHSGNSLYTRCLAPLFIKVYQKLLLYFSDTGNREVVFFKPTTPGHPAVLLCWKDAHCAHTHTQRCSSTQFCTLSSAFSFQCCHRRLMNI